MGAPARDAPRARSDAEFGAKLEALLQEADKAQLRLEFLEEDCGIAEDITLPLRQAADELLAMFVTMSDRTRKRMRGVAPG